MVGRYLSYHLKRGKLRFIGRPLYQGLIELQLTWIKNREKDLYFGATPLVDHSLTAIIKTFERPKILYRLVESIKHYYPNLKIIVVDDSRNPSDLPGVETTVMPYDSGVSAGRQKALDAVETPYVLLLDDDFIFYGQTQLEPAMEIMEKNPMIDIMGGEVINLPSFKSADYREARLYPTKRDSILPLGTTVAGLPVYDKVPNFYIARTERLKLVGWDERIKRLDHADFFTRAKGVLVTVYNPKFKILHAQTPFDSHYLSKRYDLRQDRLVLRMKYYLR